VLYPPGRGLLAIDRLGTRSVVTRAFATSPLRLLTPRNRGGAAWIYTSSYGGGLVDGDQLDISIEVRDGAAAFVSSQASTKVYRSPRGTSSEVRGRVGNGGLLIVAPDPVVCFAGARYRQAQRFHVADGGALIVVDTLLSGRCAAGERWAFGEYRSLVEVTTGGRLLVHDAMALRQSDGALEPRLGRFNVLALAVLVGHPLRREVERLLAASAAQPVARRADQLIAAAPLANDGCIVRIAGTSSEEVGRTLRSLLGCVPERLGDDPWTRKW
jgi:urease accessory protein